MLVARGDRGVRRHVESTSAVSGNWQAFFRIDENKTGFVLVLSKEGGRWQALTGPHHSPS